MVEQAEPEPNPALESIRPEQILPHRLPILLIREVVRRDESQCVCRARLESKLAVEPGRAPSLLGVEAIAQTAGLAEGLRLRESGVVLPPAAEAVGFLVSLRSVSIAGPHLPVDRDLTVDVRRVGGVAPLALYTGTVRTGLSSEEEPMVEARLGIYDASGEPG